MSELRQPVFPAADFQLLSVRARMAWGALNCPVCLNLPKFGPEDPVGSGNVLGAKRVLHVTPKCSHSTVVE